MKYLAAIDSSRARPYLCLCASPLPALSTRKCAHGGMCKLTPPAGAFAYVCSHVCSSFVAARAAAACGVREQACPGLQPPRPSFVRRASSQPTRLSLHCVIVLDCRHGYTRAHAARQRVSERAAAGSMQRRTRGAEAQEEQHVVLHPWLGAACTVHDVSAGRRTRARRRKRTGCRLRTVGHLVGDLLHHGAVAAGVDGHRRDARVRVPCSASEACGMSARMRPSGCARSTSQQS